MADRFIYGAADTFHRADADRDMIARILIAGQKEVEARYTVGAVLTRPPTAAFPA